MQRSGAAGADRKNAGRYELLLKAWDGDPGTIWAARATDEEPPSELVLVHDLPAAGADEHVADAIVEAWEWTADAKHAGVLKAEEPIIDDAGVAIVSPYVEGEPLGSLLRLASVRRLVFPAPAALRVAVDVLEALAYLHGRAAEMSIGPTAVFGGLHPNNVLVGADGRTRLLEPGIGAAISHEKVFGDDPKRAAYAAPERIEGAEPSDGTSDLFCLGILLWEQMLGKRLFGALSLAAVAKKVSSQPIDRLDATKPAGGAEIDKAVADIVERALQRNRAERYQSAGEMLDAILTCGQPVGTHEDVAKVLEQLAGKALAARRASVEKALVNGPSALPATGGAPDSRRSPTPAAPASTGAPRAAKPPEPDPEAVKKKAPPPPRVGATPQPPRAKPGGPRPGLPPKRSEADGGIEDPQTYEGELVEESAGPPRPGAPRAAKSSDPKRVSAPGDKPVGTEWEGPISEQSDEPSEDDDEGGDEEMPTAIVSAEDAKAMALGVATGAPVPRPGAAKAATPAPIDPVVAKVTDSRFDDSAHRTEDDDEPVDASKVEGAAAEDVEDVDESEQPDDGLKADAAPWGDDEGPAEAAAEGGEKPSDDEPAAKAAAATPSPTPAADLEAAGDEQPAGSKTKLILVGLGAAVAVVVIGYLAMGGGGDGKSGSTTSAAPTTELAATTTPTPVASTTETTSTESTTTETATETEEPDAGAPPETTAAPTVAAPPPGTGAKPPRKPKDKPPPRYVPDDL